MGAVSLGMAAVLVSVGVTAAHFRGFVVRCGAHGSDLCAEARFLLGVGLDLSLYYM